MAGRRGRRQSLRARRKLITVWLFLGSLAIWYRFFSKQDINDVQATLRSLLDYALFFSVLVLAYFVVHLYLKRRENTRTAELKEFKYQPWNYDRHIVQFYGKIEHVFKTSLDRKLETAITHTVRTITKDKDPTNRHPHQRFLLTSPQLKKNEKILVSHNQRFGKLPLKKGTWVELRGVYLHDRGKKRGRFGKAVLTHYGKVHYTHSPKGWINILPQKPQVLGYDGVKVEEDKRARKSQKKG